MTSIPNTSRILEMVDKEGLPFPLYVLDSCQANACHLRKITLRNSKGSPAGFHYFTKIHKSNKAYLGFKSKEKSPNKRDKYNKIYFTALWPSWCSSTGRGRCRGQRLRLRAIGLGRGARDQSLRQPERWQRTSWRGTRWICQRLTS